MVLHHFFLIRRLLDHNQKKRIYYLVILMSFSAVLEMLGIGLLLPIVFLLTDTASNAIPTQFVFDLLPEATFVLISPLNFFLFLLLIVYFIRSILLTFVNWFQASTITLIGGSMSTKLFSAYLDEDYSYHLKTNSASLIRNVVTENARFQGVLNDGLIFVSEMLVFFGIFFVLTFFEPKSAFIAFSMICIVVIIYAFSIRKVSYRWGKLLQLAEGARIKSLQEGFRTIKLIKLTGAESKFISIYRDSVVEAFRMLRNISFLVSMPRIRGGIPCSLFYYYSVAISY